VVMIKVLSAVEGARKRPSFYGLTNEQADTMTDTELEAHLQAMGIDTTPPRQPLTLNHLNPEPRSELTVIEADDYSGKTEDRIDRTVGFCIFETVGIGAVND